jgi:hypothetical protein
MLGSRLDNSHPYGMRVATGRDSTSATTERAAKLAARKADRLLAKLAKPSSNGTRRPAVRRSGQQ